MIKEKIIFIIGLLLLSGCLQLEDLAKQYIKPPVDVYKRPLPPEKARPMDLLPVKIAGSELVNSTGYKPNIEYSEGVIGNYGNFSIYVVKFDFVDLALKHVESYPVDTRIGELAWHTKYNDKKNAWNAWTTDKSAGFAWTREKWVFAVKVIGKDETFRDRIVEEFQY